MSTYSLGNSAKGGEIYKTKFKCKCDNCGKELLRTPDAFKKNKHFYCNLECQHEYVHKQTHKNRPCELCGKVMHLSKTSKKRFCSNKCQNDWQKTIVGDKNPRYNRVRVKCSWCGKEKLKFPCKTETFDCHFCNENCRRLWYSNTFSQSDEWRETSRIRAVKLLSSGAHKKMSSIQIKTNKLLNDLNIAYTNEYDCKYFAVDNYLINEKLMIEVMGDFWHVNPMTHPVIKYDRQVKRIKSDKTKRSYIKNHYGINILYLWESDLNSNIEICHDLILEYIKKNGVLDNYNSFNYSIRDNQVKLKDKIIYPYYELKPKEYKDKIQIT